MKVITEGSARVVCDQCGSTLEYQWNDIKEHHKGKFTIFCPICGNAIEVPEKITKAVSNYQTVTVSSPSLTIKGNEYWYPYETFSRDAICASNSTDGVSVISTLDSLLKYSDTAETIECDAKSALSSAQTQI